MNLEPTYYQFRIQYNSKQNRKQQPPKTDKNHPNNNTSSEQTYIMKPRYGVSMLQKKG